MQQPPVRSRRLCVERAQDRDARAALQGAGEVWEEHASNSP